MATPKPHVVSRTAQPTTGSTVRRPAARRPPSRVASNAVTGSHMPTYNSTGQLVSIPAPPPPPPPASAPAAAPAAPAPIAPPAAPDPRDSIYANAAARLLAQNEGQRGQLTSQGTQAEQDYATLVQRVAQQRDADLQSANRNANRQGLFYSGQLGKRRGAVEADAGRRQADSKLSFERSAAARQAALDALGTFAADPTSPLGYTATGQAKYDLADLYQAAIERQADANRLAPANIDDPADPAAAPLPPLPPVIPTSTPRPPTSTPGGGFGVSLRRPAALRFATPNVRLRRPIGMR